MGMNNADFMSEAVALDLGKSGVKVAETLEIEAGDEWWRLINAAAVTDGTVYRRRAAAEPVVSGGEIHLDGLTEYRGPVFPPYYNLTSLWYQKCVAIGKDQNNGLIYGVFGQNQTTGFFNLGTRPAFRVFGADGTILGNEVVLHDDKYFYSSHYMFWDAVNSRFICASRDVGNYYSAYVGAADGSSFVRLGDRFNGSWSALRDMKTFLEDEISGRVFSTYLSGGIFYFKETEITQDVVASTLLGSIFTFTGSTPLTLVQNHGNSSFIFYSRAMGSVGVMWRDSTDLHNKYVLLSENWEVVHVLQDLPQTGTIFSFGNLVVPQEGEFLVAGLSYTPSGILQRPVGWSYPANLSLIGAGEIAENRGILLGIVGTTVYHIEINLTTKAITDVFSVTASYTLGAKARLIYAAGTKEIWVRQTYSLSAHAVYQSDIFCIDSASKQMQWHFGSNEWTNSSIWGVSYTYDWLGVCSRVGNDKIVIRQFALSSYVYSYFILSIEDMIQCTSNAEFIALLATSGVHSHSPSILGGYDRRYWYGNICWNGIIYDDVYHYLLHSRSGGPKSVNPILTMQSFGRSDYLIHMPLNHYTLSSSSLLVADTASARGACVGHQKYVSPGLMTTNLRPVNTSEDGYLAVHFNKVKPYDGSSYANATSCWAFQVIGDTSLPFVAKVFGGPGTTNTGNAPESIPLNDDQSARIAFFYYGTTIAIDGAHHSGNNFGGYAQRITVPFTITNGMPCPESRRYVVFSAVANEEISWAEVDGRCGQYRKYYGYRSTDITDVYEVTGLDVSGGYNVINFQGRAITGVTGVGRMALLDLDTADDDGYDEVSVGSFSNVVYEYLDQQYLPYPFAREGIRAELSNISKTTKITLPETQDNLIRGMLAAGTDFRGSRCILRRVFPDHMDEAGSDIVLLDGYIQDWSYVPGKKGIAFSVSKTLIDVGAQFPKRLMNMGCSHVFKGSRCRYLGEEGRCLKTKTFCTSLGNLNQFGGFPWVAARQRRVMWK